MWWLCIPAERSRQEACCELGAGWGEELAKARVVPVFTGVLSKQQTWSVASSRTWASVVDFQITQPQLSAAGHASSLLSRASRAD